MCRLAQILQVAPHLNSRVSGTDSQVMRPRVILFCGVASFVAACAGTAGPSGDPDSQAVLAGAGDIGWCGSAGVDQTARLLDAVEGTVFTTGDNAYPIGSETDFRDCYDPFWGRHRSRTRPSAGNHDWASSAGGPYFQYFGALAGPGGLGYYSYTLGSWHVVVLNSNLDMSAGSPQEGWLRADLAAHPVPCTLAYWHHPLFSSALHGNDPRSTDAWRALLAARADVVLNGHDHVYERFAPQTAEAIPDGLGIRQFTVGTGGAPLYGFGPARANSEVRLNDSVGVLRLVLRSGAYSWQFIAPGYLIADAGSSPCRQ